VATLLWPRSGRIAKNRHLQLSKDALAECGDQHAVRDAACKRLGPEPYSPVIDPANFVDKIDNPYFPLTPGTVFIYEGQQQMVLNGTTSS
jgi:hypothetical protein